MVAQDGGGQPGVVRLHLRAEPRQQPVERAAEVAEAHDPDPRPAEQARARVARPAPGLAPFPKGRIRGADPAREVDREAEPDLRHRHGEGGARGEHMDPAAENLLVGHVVREVRFDIEHGAELAHAREHGVRDRRLAQDVARGAQHRVVEPGHLRGRRLDQPVPRAKVRQRLRPEDQVERARLGRAEDERSGILGHAWTSMRTG